MPRSVSSVRFVGRADELGVLEAALGRAERGEPSAAFLAGESGVGKSRLLAELEARALARGVRVLRGDCVAFGAGGLPYAPIGAALRDLVRQLGPAEDAEVLGPARDDLARLLPELAPSRPPTEDPGVSDRAAIGEPLAQARLFGVLLGLLDRLSRPAPGTPTPRGTFLIRNRLEGFEDPAYGPVAFGTRARTTAGVVGIQGTDEPDRVGRAVTSGSIRMRNADIRRLGELMEVGTPVTIRG